MFDVKCYLRNFFSQMHNLWLLSSIVGMQVGWEGFCAYSLYNLSVRLHKVNSVYCGHVKRYVIYETDGIHICICLNVEQRSLKYQGCSGPRDIPIYLQDHIRDLPRIFVSAQIHFFLNITYLPDINSYILRASIYKISFFFSLFNDRFFFITFKAIIPFIYSLPKFLPVKRFSTLYEDKIKDEDEFKI